jgi:transcriptional regulator
MDSVPHFLLADNQDVTRAGLRAYIAETFGQAECRTIDVANKKELIEALTACGGSGIVVLDYTLFDLAGVEELLILVRRFSEVAWLLCSNELSDALIRRLSAEHRVGMILKDCTADEIRAALRHTVQGDRFLCSRIADFLLTVRSQPEINEKLTATETEILRLIARGLSVKEIAAERISSTHTIITHKKNIFRKLGVNNVYEATKYALRAGLVEMVEYYI